MRNVRWLGVLLLAAVVLGGACGTGPEPSSETPDTVGATLLAELTRAAVASQLERSQDGFLARLDGPEPGAGFRKVTRPLSLSLPATANGEIVAAVGHDQVTLRRRGVGSDAGRSEAGVLRHPGSAIEVASFAMQTIFEEIFVVHHETQLGYDLGLPSDWTAERVDRRVVEIRDERRRAQIRISADRAWDAEGEEVSLSLRVDDAGIAIDLGDVQAWPVFVDPSFVDASVPLKLRQNHSTTLLTDGRVLIVGGEIGSIADASAEIYDPMSGTSTAIASLAEARRRHTATMLMDGRVLIAGGEGASADLASTELFDPVTGTFSAGPALSVTRDAHTATRLQDGRVLLADGNDRSVDIFDPSTDTIAPTASLPSAFSTSAGALLESGRVLFVSADGVGLISTEFDPTANAGAGDFINSISGPADFFPGGSTLTRLRDGRVLSLGGCPCFSVGGPIFTSEEAYLYNPAGPSWAPTGDQVRARSSHTATLLPNGNVLVAGGNDTNDPNEEQSAEIYDAGAGTFTLLSDMVARHRNHTATLLPSGEVLVFGGTEAAFELYTGGMEGSFTNTDDTTIGRDSHRMTLLTTGEVLVTGSGVIDPFGANTPSDAAELFDPTTDQFSTTGAMSAKRTNHAALLLQNGDVLVTGGNDGSFNASPIDTAEIYDRTAGTFTDAGTMTQARHHHAMVTLPGGNVLIVGGAGNTAEIYDPNAGTFTATSTNMSQDRGRTGAALLPTGKVLIVSGTTSELYDPSTDTFEALDGPGASYTVPRLVVLQTGKALVTGSYTQSGELFDPADNTYSFTGADSVGRSFTELVALPNGLAMELGGENLATERTVYNKASLFLPLGNGAQGVFDAAATMINRTRFAAATLADGDVLVTGGIGCLDICIGPPSAAQRWSPVGDPSWRPIITDAPAQVEPGAVVSLTGTGFTGPAGTGGRYGASASNHPVVTWQPFDQSATIAGTILSWTGTTASWQVPSTAYYGLGWLRITVSGIPSVAKLVEIQVAPVATGCQHDAECASGFCTDGVCCDGRCGERCEACTAALKGSGDDGECGTVPPERDPDDDCVLSPGAPCDDAVQCDSGFCVDGLCCDSLCSGQCEACDVQGSEGQCVPVTGVPHDDRPACNASPPADACEALVCDGTDRTTCAGTIGPCDPYACTIDGCLDSCDNDDDCAIGHHCEDGECVTGQCNGTVAITPEGQEIDCAPYICQADGSCRTSCADVSDCADPFGCDFSGRCVQRPPNDVPSDCACRVVGAGRDTSDAGWLAGLLLLGLCARRRRRGLSQLLFAAVLAGALLPVATASAQEKTTDEKKDETAEAETPPETPPAPTPPDEEAQLKLDKEKARDHFRKGVELFGKNAWRPALAEFLQSREIYATRVATKNAAICYEQLERYDDALSMYEALLRDFDDLPPEDQGAAQRAIVKLRKLVGTIEIDDAEVGSAIVIDGTHRGTYPPPSPLRAAAGTHIVRVYKEGFEPFEARVDLAGGATAKVKAKLAALKSTGLLKVTEAKGRKLEVLVDNVMVGHTPWEGRLSPGAHTVRLEGEDKLGTAPVPAPVKAQETTTLNLEAKLLDATLRIEPTPANAEVTLDSVVLGRGVWEGAVPSGAHDIEVIADGFFTKKRKVELNKDGHEDVLVTLERDDDADIWSVPGKFTIDVIGAADVVPTFGGDVVTGCGDDCSSGIGFGGYVKLSIGYEFPSGWGLGATGGYITLSQDVEGRDTLVQPVGLSERPGSATDNLTLFGPFAGVYGSYLFDSDYPILARLAAGPVFTTVRDERTGSFPVDEGGAYQAGPITQEPTAIFLLINPEVRVGMKIGDHLHVGVGLEVPVMVALQLPTWDSAREINAAEDGIGAFGSESLTGRVVVGLAPNAGVRAHF